MKQKEEDTFLCCSEDDYDSFPLSEEKDLESYYYIRFHINQGDKFVLIDDCCTFLNSFIMEYEIDSMSEPLHYILMIDEKS